MAFNCVLDTDVNADGSLDTGLFVWSGGALRLVARTGTVIPGVGTVAQLVMWRVAANMDWNTIRNFSKRWANASEINLAGISCAP